MRGNRDEPLGMPALGCEDCIVSNAILKRIELLHGNQFANLSWGLGLDGGCPGAWPCHGAAAAESFSHATADAGSRGNPLYPSFACNGVCGDRPSTERQIDPSSSNPAIGQEACDGHLSCCSSLSYICSPRSFAKVLRTP